MNLGNDKLKRTSSDADNKEKIGSTHQGLLAQRSSARDCSSPVVDMYCYVYISSNLRTVTLSRLQRRQESRE
ncbi:hypothetical protein J6590_091167 [Homalodisca vitripennis]|nr:hypothetical protein J6590_091167 [Homalodisca vitripennis]